MNPDILTVEPETTLRAAAQRMSERNAGAALVVDTASGSSSGILTERDLLDSIAAGQDPDKQSVADNSTPKAVTVQAVEKMTEGDFRHLLVVHEGETVGIVSMRDLVLALTGR